MGHDKIHTVTPIHTFTLQPTQIEYYSFSRLITEPSTRLLSVYETSSDADGEGSEQLQYYIDTKAEWTLPIWPFNGTQAVSIFSGSKSTGSLLQRTEKPLETMTQSHALGGRFMCTVGGIRPTTSDPASEQEKPGKHLTLYSGLGHGSWTDEELEKDLGHTRRRDNEMRLAWQAKGDDWDVYLEDGLSHLNWAGKGSVKGGGLILSARKKVLAVYKPRCARFLPDAEKRADSKTPGADDGSGIGFLGICDERLDGDMMRHVLLSAVAIEEQIMWSKGFDPGAYHGRWM